MKVRADEHVSPEIVRVVRGIALKPSWDLTHVYEEGHGGYPDVTWITQFRRSGGNAILSADADFHKRPHQIMAICETGLIVIHMPPKWANSCRCLQAAHILYWWDKIEQTLLHAAPRQCWKVPWGFSEKAELQRIKVDYEQARKKTRKATRRTPPVSRTVTRI